MDQAMLLNYAQTALTLILEISMVPILVATVVGLLVSLLQALTQVQEQTLGFAIKLIAVAITLMFSAQWMGAQLIRYTQEIFSQFPYIAN